MICRSDSGSFENTFVVWMEGYVAFNAKAKYLMGSSCATFIALVYQAEI